MQISLIHRLEKVNIDTRCVMSFQMDAGFSHEENHLIEIDFLFLVDFNQLCSRLVLLNVLLIGIFESFHFVIGKRFEYVVLSALFLTPTYARAI
jgi:hypothetical protein